MSAFTDRLYRQWTACNHGGQAYRSVLTSRHEGYGAKLHESEARRREGYPIGQQLPHRSCEASRPARPWHTTVAASRNGSPRAIDAASRPDKTAVCGLPPSALFLQAQEISSMKTMA